MDIVNNTAAVMRLFPNERNLCEKCNSIRFPDPRLKCQRCLRQYHVDCLRMSIRQAIEETFFICDSCDKTFQVNKIKSNRVVPRADSFYSLASHSQRNSAIIDNERADDKQELETVVEIDDDDDDDDECADEEEDDDERKSVTCYEIEETNVENNVELSAGANAGENEFNSDTLQEVGSQLEEDCVERLKRRTEIDTNTTAEPSDHVPVIEKKRTLTLQRTKQSGQRPIATFRRKERSVNVDCGIISPDTDDAGAKLIPLDYANMDAKAIKCYKPTKNIHRSVLSISAESHKYRPVFQCRIANGLLRTSEWIDIVDMRAMIDTGMLRREKLQAFFWRLYLWHHEQYRKILDKALDPPGSPQLKQYLEALIESEVEEARELVVREASAKSSRDSNWRRR